MPPGISSGSRHSRGWTRTREPGVREPDSGSALRLENDPTRVKRCVARVFGWSGLAFRNRDWRRGRGSTHARFILCPPECDRMGEGCGWGEAVIQRSSEQLTIRPRFATGCCRPVFLFAPLESPPPAGVNRLAVAGDRPGVGPEPATALDEGGLDPTWPRPREGDGRQPDDARAFDAVFENPPAWTVPVLVSARQHIGPRPRKGASAECCAVRPLAGDSRQARFGALFC